MRPLEAVPASGDGAEGTISLFDPARITEGVLAVSSAAFAILTLLDREKSLEAVIAEVGEKYKFSPEPGEVMALIRQVDEALLLDNDRFARFKEEARRKFMEAPARKAMFAGQSYPEDRDTLAKELKSFLEGSPVRKDAENIKAIVTPHIDYRIGADLMAAGWREIADSDADLFIILGVGHALSGDFFACLDKDFETPVGVVKTDKKFLKTLGEKFGEDLYLQAEAHKNEHSIEFASIFLPLFSLTARYRLFPSSSPFQRQYGTLSIASLTPKGWGGLSRRSRKRLDSCGKKVMYVASVDFAHVGARFGDPAHR